MKNSQTQDPVHVVCACNAGYIMPLCVMLSSLVDNFNKDRDLVIHILNNDATPELRDNVRKSLQMNRADLSRIDIQWHAVKPLNFSVKNPRHTMDVFSRLYAPYILPESIDRAVYLDCDIVVLNDISIVYDETANGTKVLHAVHDQTIPWVTSRQGVFDYKERGIPADAPYFNSGVLVMHFKRWRDLNVTERLIDYIVEYGAKIGEADQGALNALLWNEWDHLDQRWNTHACLNVASNRKQTGLSKEVWDRLRLHPYIVHYTGDKKPWLKGHVFPRYSYFYNYLQKTVYKDSIPNYPKLENYVGVRLYYHLWNTLRRLPRPRRTPAVAHYEESNA